MYTMTHYIYIILGIIILIVLIQKYRSKKFIGILEDELCFRWKYREYRLDNNSIEEISISTIQNINPYEGRISHFNIRTLKSIFKINYDEISENAIKSIAIRNNIKIYYIEKTHSKDISIIYNKPKLENKERNEWEFEDYQLEVGINNHMQNYAKYFAKFKNSRLCSLGSSIEEVISKKRNWFLKYKNKYPLPNPYTDERFKPITNFELIYLTLVLRLVQIKTSEECLIIVFEIIDDQNVKDDFMEYIFNPEEENNYEILSFFESVTNGNIEIKIHGKNVENWKIGIEQRYLNKKLTWLEISKTEIEFMEFVQGNFCEACGTDMLPVIYENFEIKKI